MKKVIIVAAIGALVIWWIALFGAEEKPPRKRGTVFTSFAVGFPVYREETLLGEEEYQFCGILADSFVVSKKSHNSRGREVDSTTLYLPAHRFLGKFDVACLPVLDGVIYLQVDENLINCTATLRPWSEPDTEKAKPQP